MAGLFSGLATNHKQSPQKNLTTFSYHIRVYKTRPLTPRWSLQIRLRTRPSEKWSIIEEGDLPELDKEFAKLPKALGKTDVQIAHVNDEGTWEVGRHVGTRYLHKFKNATRDHFSTSFACA